MRQLAPPVARDDTEVVRCSRLLTKLLLRLGWSGVSPTMVKGSIWSISGEFAGAAASFIAQMILARTLQPTRYGVYTYLLAWVNVAILLGKLEFDTAAIRFVATYDGQRQHGLLHGFLRHAWRLVGGTATIVALLAASAAWLLRGRLPAGMAAAVWAAFLLVPLSAMLAFSSSVLQGLRRVPQAQLPQLVLRPALFGIGILLAGSGLGFELAAREAVALNTGATAVALGVSLFLLARAVPASALTAAPAFETAKWMSAVRGFMVIAVAQLVLSQQADVLVVGTLLGPRDAGLYSVASQLSALIGLAANGVFFVVLPVISDLHARGRGAELQHLVVRTVQACATVTIPVAAVLCVAGPFVLRWYGAAFVDAYPVLLVLSAVQLAANTIGGLSGFLLIASGHEWQASRVVVGTALLNVALTFVLTPLFGILGAATATAVAGLTRVGLMRWHASRYLGVAVLPYLPLERRGVEGD
jgi:O-antigen/teichoic acid export membrane protein